MVTVCAPEKSHLKEAHRKQMSTQRAQCLETMVKKVQGEVRPGGRGPASLRLSRGGNSMLRQRTQQVQRSKVRSLWSEHRGARAGEKEEAREEGGGGAGWGSR
jgi:hypothetical protein